MKFIKNYSKEYKVNLTKALLSEIENDLLDESEPDIKINLAGQAYDDALKFMQNPSKMDGVASGFSGIDKTLRGFVGGELTILTGVSGHGKSTFLEAMLLNMTLDNVPVLFVSLEENQRQILVKLIKQIRSKTTDPAILKELPLYLYHGEIANVDVLEAVVKKAVESGIKFIAVDNTSFFSSRETEEESNLAIRLKLMARKYDVPILAIAHLRKMNSIERIPTMDDIKGSSSFYQDADQFLVLWQDMTGCKINKFNTLVIIRKNRRHGSRDSIEFQFDDHLFPIEVAKHYTDLY